MSKIFLTVSMLSVLGMAHSATAENKVEGAITKIYWEGSAVVQELKTSELSVGDLKSQIQSQKLQPLMEAIQKIARAQLQMNPTESLNLKLRSIQLGTEKSPITTVRFDQYLRLKNKGEKPNENIQIIGADAVAVIDQQGRLESLNLGLIRPPASSVGSITGLDLGLTSLGLSDKAALTTAFGGEPTEALIEALDYINRHRKLGIKDMKAHLLSVSTAEERSELVLNILRTTDSSYETLQFFALLRKDDERASKALGKPANRVQLILQKQRQKTQLLWRLTTPFDLPVILDLTADQPKMEVVRVKSIFRGAAEISIIKAGPVFPFLKLFNNVKSRFESNQPVPTKGALFKLPKEVVDVSTTVKSIHNYYDQSFSWKSFDNKDSAIDVYYDAKLPMMRENAGWLRAPYNFFIFGAGGEYLADLNLSVDVAGHEFTHAVVSATSQLDDAGEPGALNEHVADIMGLAIKSEVNLKSPEMINFDLGDGVLTEKARKEATIKRGQPVVALRSILNPKASFSDQMIDMKEVETTFGDSCTPTEKNDDCGVHDSAGIPNLAVGRIIQRVKWSRMKEMFYEVFTKRLRSTSDFRDYALQMELACSKSLTLNSLDCEAIREEFARVGVKPLSN